MELEKKENMENEIMMTDNKYVKFPKKLSGEKTKNEDGSVKIDPLSKLVYLFLVYEKSRRGDCFTPSYDYLLNKYGISTKNYSSALNELSDLGYIVKEIVPFRNTTRIQVKIVDDSITSKWSAIPLQAILTDVYTNNQKILIVTIFSLFFYDFKRTLNSVSVTIRDIAERSASVGLKKTFVYKAMKELSDPDSGFINLFYTDGSSTRYFLNIHSWQLITNRLILKIDPKNKKYIKPKKGMFYLVGNDLDGYSIAENKSIVRDCEDNRKKKGDKIKESSRLKEEAIEKFNDELYKNQEYEINKFIKENGL